MSKQKPEVVSQFSTEDSAVPLLRTELTPAEIAALEARPPSQNEPEVMPPVPPLPPVEELAPYPGSAAKGVFVMPDGTVVRNT